MTLHCLLYICTHYVVIYLKEEHVFWLDGLFTRICIFYEIVIRYRFNVF